MLVTGCHESPRHRVHMRPHCISSYRLTFAAICLWSISSICLRRNLNELSLGSVTLWFQLADEEILVRINFLIDGMEDDYKNDTVGLFITSTKTIGLTVTNL